MLRLFFVVAMAWSLRWSLWGRQYRIVGRSPVLNLNQTFFSSLNNYEVNAVPAREQDYPWVARVLHSRVHDYPHRCTASCIERDIFVTAARCLYWLKINYTTVIYNEARLTVRAFVLPSERSKQGFDDIGFVVAEPGHSGPWATLALIDQNRTDDAFEWLDQYLSLSPEPDRYKVVGYAMLKGRHKHQKAEAVYSLTELSVTVNMDLCHKIMRVNHRFDGFRVPCYHSCTVDEFHKIDQKCQSYHGVEGGALIDASTNRLIGVATWGAMFAKHELPVGYSVPNSANFYMDYECARLVRDDDRPVIVVGHYQSLCPEEYLTKDREKVFFK